ncbi:MAG TPA: hypothetical protein VJN63_08035, partial [Thermoplasmata archaeon]|nr:hypothetical protein [Thermoplasmata archaeon]
GAASLWRWVRGPRAVPAMGATAEEAAAPQAAKFPENPVPGRESLLVDAGPAGGGGQRVAFQTPKGYRVEFHTGHSPPNPHTSPHYQVYGVTGVKSTGAIAGSSRPIARFDVGDAIPNWLDF